MALRDAGDAAVLATVLATPVQVEAQAVLVIGGGLSDIGDGDFGDGGRKVWIHVSSSIAGGERERERLRRFRRGASGR